MRAIVSSLLVAAVAACTLLPREEIATFTTAYGDVDRAARAVYMAYSSRQEDSSAARSANAVDRFGLNYISLLDQAVAERQQQVSSPIVPRIAALDSMLAFNDGLLGLAEGRRVEEVKARLAPVSATIGTALGPYAGVARQGLELLLKGIEASQSREDLRRALSINISVSYKDSVTKKQVTLDGHPTDVMLELLAADLHDFKIVVRAAASQRFTELTEQLLAPETSQDPAEQAAATAAKAQLLAERAAAVDDARAFMQALDDYESLLMRSRIHFDALRQAAFSESKVLQTAEFARLTLDLGADARALVRSLR